MPHQAKAGTNPATGARHEEPLGTTRPPCTTTEDRTGSPTLQAQTSARRLHPPTPTRAEPTPHAHRDSLAQPGAHATCAISNGPPARAPALALAPEHAAFADNIAQVGAPCHESPTLTAHWHRPKLAQTLAGTHRPGPHGTGGHCNR